MPMQGGQRATGQVKSGRFLSLKLFWERGTSEGNLESSEIIVWLRLWEVEGQQQDEVAMISLSQFVRDTGRNRSTILRALAGLKEKPMVKRVHEGTHETDASHYVIAPYPSEKILADKDADYGRGALLTRRTMRLVTRRIFDKTQSHDAPLPDRKEEVVTSSSFQTRRADPADVRLGDARPAVPTEQTNSDGGTIPLCPPSASTHADGSLLTLGELIIQVKIVSALQAGKSWEEIETDLRRDAKNDPAKIRIIRQEINRARGVSA